MKYNQPYGVVDITAGYVNGDPSIGRAGSIPPAEAIEYPQREIVNLILDAGLATPANTDLHQLARAVQSGKLYYGVDTGTPNNVAVLLTPAPLAYTAGLLITVKMLNNNTGASVMNVNSLGNKPITRGATGGPLTGGEWAIGDLVTFRYDGTNFQMSGVSAGTYVRLSANKTIFVNGAIGNDANDGLSNVAGHALATIQAAINLAFNYAPSQFAITIQIADGTYAPAATPLYSGPNLIVLGNPVTPGNVIISSTTPSSPCLTVRGPNTMTVKYLKVQSTTGPDSYGFYAGSGATMTCDLTESGPVINPVFTASNGSMGVGVHTFRGNCESFYYAGAAGLIQIGVVNQFTPSSISVSVATAQVSQGGTIHLSASPPTYYGNVTGPRYQGTFNGIFYVQGAGVNVFPGTVAGILGSGAQYG